MFFKIYNIIFSFINTYRLYFTDSLFYNLEKKKIDKLVLKKNPLISIICPTYNRCDLLLKRAVKSVLKQTYKNFEFLIISDGSSDNTKYEVKKIKDKRIKFYEISRKKNYPETVENHWFCGPVNAINYGLKKIKGDWICRIDDDDIWTSNHIKLLLKFSRKNKFEFVSSSLNEIRFNKRKINKGYEFKDKKLIVGGVQTWLYASYLKFFKSNIHCWRKNYNKVNDTDLQDRFIKAKIKMGYLDYPTALIKPRPGDQTIGLRAYKMRKDFYLKKYNFS